ncbi:MAG: RNA-binding protein [Pseudanabaenaceae cyanobacterium SKYGB_i_bin29]|nr:RNA-binding protein [Pseudanabaenaceae cyanobacterium SKYG29]MDW8421910.1 RNA-binding protein [Pseudanabaenaceae cyanobacterium SKYGB_i_bin29]
MSVRLYVGNLPAELDRKALEQVFSQEGETLTVKVITDRKTGRCRGFGFLTVATDEQADSMIQKFNGFDFHGSALRLEKALPRQKEQKDRDKGDQEVVPVSEEVEEAVPTDTPSELKAEEKQPAKRKRKRKKGSNRPEKRTSYTTSDSHQPDPRWAAELEEFKQRLLAAQST